MKNRDKNTYRRFTKFRYYFLLSAIFFAVSGIFLAIFYTIPHSTKTQMLYAILAEGTFMFAVSVLLAYLIDLLYKNFIYAPIEKLSVAAREVANGNFGVRLEPVRKDGKSDEFQELVDNFNTMAAELQSAEMLKKDFISNISHEFKTPLAVIQNYATLLHNGGLTQEESKDYTAKIADASMRLTVLVTDVLQLSNLENQKITVCSKPIILSEQLCRCALGYEHILDEKDIAFETDFDETVAVNGDERLLDIVWNNLISNALKFTDKGGKVKISVKRQGGFAVVSVEDNGCGMNKTQIKHIFDKFYQGDSSHATDGNGLGLALVSKICVLTKAEVKVESTPRKGSRFTVKILLSEN